MTSPDSPNATFSPGSGAGPSRSNSRGGRKPDPSGPAPVPANLSLSPGSKKGSLTPATFGLTGSVSLRSAHLQSCLVCRLQVLLTGSPECEVIWAEWTTPWGQSLSKPRARVRLSSEIDIGLWPTVSTEDHKTDGPKTMLEIRQALRSNRPIRQSAQRLRNFVQMALWPQTASRDWKNSKASQKTLTRNSRPRNELVFSVWSALRATDGAKGGPNQSFGAGGSPLPSQVFQTARNSSHVQTANTDGSLHPEFAGWEMGFPPEWLEFAL